MAHPIKAQLWRIRHSCSSAPCLWYYLLLVSSFGPQYERLILLIVFPCIQPFHLRPCLHWTLTECRKKLYERWKKWNWFTFKHAFNAYEMSRLYWTHRRCRCNSTWMLSQHTGLCIFLMIKRVWPDHLFLFDKTAICKITRICRRMLLVIRPQLPDKHQRVTHSSHWFQLWDDPLLYS